MAAQLRRGLPDLVGLLELGRVVLVVLSDLGVLDRDLFLEVFGLDDDVIGGSLFGDPVARGVLVEVGPELGLGRLFGDLGLGRIGDEILDLGESFCFR